MPIDSAPEISEVDKENQVDRSLKKLLAYTKKVIKKVNETYPTDTSIYGPNDNTIETLENFEKSKGLVGFWRITLGDIKTIGIHLTSHTGIGGKIADEYIALQDGSVYPIVNKGRSGVNQLTVRSSLSINSIPDKDGNSYPLYSGAEEDLGQYVQLSNDSDTRKQNSSLHGYGFESRTSDGRNLVMEYGIFEPKRISLLTSTEIDQLITS